MNKKDKKNIQASSSSTSTNADAPQENLVVDHTPANGSTPSENLKSRNKREGKKKITKDMTFGDVMERDPEAAFKLMDMGMMCGGCAIAQFETVEEGCNAHGTDVKKILDRLNEEKGERNGN